MDDLAGRKAQLIAQSDLDRMRLSHALLTTRRSLSPAALLSSGGAGMRSFAGEALAFGLPLFARRSGALRIAAFALAAIRTLRRFMRR
jgi:hypothetical protein